MVDNNLHTINEWKIEKAGDIFIFGIKGSGKTCKLLTFSQAMLDNGFIKKWWHIFGGDRDEGPLLSFPNRDLNLWNDLENETFEFENEGPKQYKITYAKPMFSKTMPEQLPEDMPNVECEVFTIPFRKIDKKQIACAIGEVGKTAETLWENIIEDTNSKSNGEDIKFLMEHKYKKQKKSAFYQLFIKPMIDNHFFASEDSELNLNLIKESEKRDRIFVLSLDDVPSQFKLFVMSYIITNLYDLVKRNKIYKDHLLTFNEASLFMKQVDSDKNRDMQSNAFRNIIVDQVRYGRVGIFYGMDTQDSSEVKGLIDGQQEILAICELPSQNSIEATCVPLKRAGRMNDAQIAFVQWKIQKHQICIIQRGKRAVILQRINPPRSCYWKPEYRNFITFWKKEKDKWIESKIFLDKIKKEYLDRDEFLTIINSKEEDFEEEYENETELEDIKSEEEKEDLDHRTEITKIDGIESSEEEIIKDTPVIDLNNLDEVNNGLDNQQFEDKNKKEKLNKKEVKEEDEWASMFE